MEKQRLITKHLDNAVLFACCLIVAARCQMNEAFPAGWKFFSPSATNISGPEMPTMLIFAAAIWSLAFVWLGAHLLEKDFCWKKTCLGAPLLITLLASVVSCWAASNKQTAIVGAINWASPIVLALLLIQVLDAPWKRQFLLCVLIATGVTLAYRCIEQKSEVETNTRFVMDNPEQALARQGIQPGTHAAKQYLGRIKSGDIGGFLAISNTAASLLILTLITVLALWLRKIGECANEERTIIIVQSTIWMMLIIIHLWLVWLTRRNGGIAGFPCALITAFVVRKFYHSFSKHWKLTTLIALCQIMILLQLWALWLTQSKGGIGGFLCALVMAIVLWRFRDFLSRHWKRTTVIAVVLLALGCLAIVGHGLTHGRLPSVSMWVRWQYWSATGQMIADHWFSGVGPQNFGTWYTLYMDPTAPEVVKDPHNFLVALWSQWGIFGLVAFFWGAVAVTAFVARPGVNPGPQQPLDSPGPALWLAGLGLTALIIVIRWLTAGVSGISDLEKQSYLLVAFIVPGAVWFISFCFSHSLARFAGESDKVNKQNVALLFLGTALLGFLIHNVIDFAIFQPGVCTAFFAAIALVISVKSGDRTAKSLTLKVSTRILSFFLGMILIGAVWVSAAGLSSSTYLLRYAQLNDDAIPAVSSIEKKVFLLTHDQMDPECYSFAGKLSHAAWKLWYPDAWKLLDLSISATRNAVRLDPDNYKNYRRLGELNVEAAVAYPDQKEKLLLEAKKNIEATLLRYPGSAESVLLYGCLLSEMGQKQDALKQYRAAIKLEESFVGRQREMFPHEEPHPGRLAPDQLRRIQQEIERLSEKNVTDLPQVNP